MNSQPTAAARRGGGDPNDIRRPIAGSGSDDIRAMMRVQDSQTRAANAARVPTTTSGLFFLGPASPSAAGGMGSGVGNVEGGGGGGDGTTTTTTTTSASSVSAHSMNFGPPGLQSGLGLVGGGGGGGGGATTTTSTTSSTAMKMKMMPKFALQRLPLSLDKAVAPSIPRPTAPFAKNERKRAMLNASYYSECFLNKIMPVDADTAAVDAQHRYEKWWVKSKYNSKNSNRSSGPSSSRKRRRVQQVDGGGGATTNSPTNRSPKRSVSASSDTNTDNNADGNNNNNNASYTYVTSEDESTRKRSRGGCKERTAHHYHHYHSPVSIQEISMLDRMDADKIATVKDAMIAGLKSSGGDTTTPEFQSCLHTLELYYQQSRINNNNSSSSSDVRWGLKGVTKKPVPVDGTWLTLSKPTYSECLGTNPKGQHLYNLGRMSFDMFRPTQLRCSIQGVFNVVSPASHDNNKYSDENRRPRSFPRKLQKGYGPDNAPTVRNYDIVVALTIEANQTRSGATPSAATDDNMEGGDYVVRKPIRALLTNHGYCVPDPETPNRLSVWFSGGALELHEDDGNNDEEGSSSDSNGRANSSNSSLKEWCELFDSDKVPPRDLRQYARVLAARVLLGAHVSDTMTDDGTLSYTLNRPIGGHGQVFVDVLYGDEEFRVVRGHHGCVYVFSKVPIVSDDE